MDEHEYHGTRNGEPWWKRARASLWHGLNIAAAAALAVYVCVFRDPAWYEWFSSHRMLFSFALVGLVGAVPLISLLRRRGHEDLAVWAIAATVVVALAAGRASADASDYQHSNCWTIRESGDPDEGGLVEIMECTPDGGEPIQGSGWSSVTESGSSRSCEHIDTSSSGGTIWRCESENF